jgi:hypothetical protein
MNPLAKSCKLVLKLSANGELGTALGYSTSRMLAELVLDANSTQKDHSASIHAFVREEKWPDSNMMALSQSSCWLIQKPLFGCLKMFRSSRVRR